MSSNNSLSEGLSEISFSMVKILLSFCAWSLFPNLVIKNNDL